MKIVQTPIRFYPYTGGTEQVALQASRILVKRGHKVKIICANEPDSDQAMIDGIEVKRLPFITKIANTNITLSLYRQLMKEDFDILHTYLPHPWSADISAIVAAKKGKPLFVTYNNDVAGDGFNSFIAWVYNSTALKGLLKRSRKIFTTTPGYINRSSFLRPFADKVVVAPLGVDQEKFKPIAVESSKEGAIFFLSVLDKFHKYKGVDYLLSAFKNIADKVTAKLYIAGKGELLDYYKRKYWLLLR